MEKRIGQNKIVIRRHSQTLFPPSLISFPRATFVFPLRAHDNLPASRNWKWPQNPYKRILKSGKRGFCRRRSVQRKFVTLRTKLQRRIVCDCGLLGSANPPGFEQGNVLTTILAHWRMPSANIRSIDLVQSTIKLRGNNRVSIGHRSIKLYRCNLLCVSNCTVNRLSPIYRNKRAKWIIDIIIRTIYRTNWSRK